MSRYIINSVPFNTRVLQGARQILAHDTARAQRFIAGFHPHGPVSFHARRAKHAHHGHRGHGGLSANPVQSPPDQSIDVTDAGVTYTMSVNVGQPATAYTLLIDTGSSNTWVGASTAYNPTSTSKNTGNTVNVSYGSGSFTGTEYTDQVALGGGLVIPSQSIGVASSAKGFQDVDGIVGIGPVDLTQGTVDGTSSVPTVTDNLYKNGIIATESIGISYVPTTAANVANGELTFGETDPSKYTGDITYVPITSTSPASKYWGIDQQVSYGSTPLLTGNPGIVDTGTTLLLLATDAFNAYQKAIGAVLDSTTGLLTVTEAQYGQMQNLVFTIGSATFELTPNAQIWPRSLNSTLGGQDGTIYLITADLGSQSGSGLDFINGFGFLQRFYSVFDTTNSQVGLATTPYTDAETN